MILVNPKAGRGYGVRVARGLQKAGFASGGLEVVSGARVLAAKLQELRGREERIFVAGGDGTARLAVQVLAGSETALGVIPAGTGNDFARSLGVRRGSLRDLERLLFAGVRKRVDVGSAGGRVFCSVCGWGFAGLVAAAAQAVPFVRGTLPFFFGILRQLPAWGRDNVRVTVPGYGVQGRYAAVLVQNTPYTGGGMKLAPAAGLRDGKLDLLLVEPVPRAKLLRHLPSVMVGRHLLQPFFQYFQVERVLVETEQKVVTTLDGDIFTESPREAHVVADALWVVVPGDGNDTGLSKG
ncbi:MAG: diacylglycerol kinase family lipid kinase [Acidobacteriota bacterium]